MATTYDKASLVMIPSGVKESKLYSIKPTNGSGDFTFSRGTDTATRVNSSGLIEKERSNQLLQSNTFSNASWTKTRATLTGGQSGYDGTNDAWAFIDDTNNSTHLLYQPLTSVGAEVATMSVYAKKGDVDFMSFRFEGAAVDYAYFDLANGTLGTIDSDYIEARITDVGGGWYRCEATRVLASSGNQAIILPAETDNDPTYAGAGTAAIYIQDAQVEYGLVAQPYIETTTAAVYEGITDNLPRLDYSGGASCPSLLLEPSRTNLIAHSEYIGGLTSSNVTLTANATTSPEGLQNAYQIDDDATNGEHKIEQTITSTTAVHSAFVKSNGGEFVQLVGVGTAWYQNFDIASGVLGTGDALSADIEDYGNGWYRIWAYDGNPNTKYQLNIVDSASANRARQYAGDGSNSIFIWGLQCEAGSYPTSYIPTYGTSASRAFDDCEITSASDLFGASQGSVYVEGTAILDTNGSMPFTAGSGSANLIYAWFRTNGSINFDFYQGGSLQASITTAVGTISNGDSFKLAVGYQDNDFVAYLNGTQVGTDTSGTAPNPDTFILGGYIAPDYYGSGIKQALLFKTRLTNAELAALTA